MHWMGLQGVALCEPMVPGPSEALRSYPAIPAFTPCPPSRDGFLASVRSRIREVSFVTEATLLSSSGCHHSDIMASHCQSSLLSD
jgi:hypothetical protein